MTPRTPRIFEAHAEQSKTENADLAGLLLLTLQSPPTPMEVSIGSYRIAQAALTKKTAKRADVLAAVQLLAAMRPLEDAAQMTVCETLVDEGLLYGYGTRGLGL